MSVLKDDLNIRELSQVRCEVCRQQTTNAIKFGRWFSVAESQYGQTFCPFITERETWSYHNTLETKQVSKLWISSGKLTQNMVEVVLSAKKVIVAGFWDARSILRNDYFQKEIKSIPNIKPIGSMILWIVKGRICIKFLSSFNKTNQVCIHAPSL